MPDAELLTALKMAKSKKMFFAFIPRGGSDGQLIVSKTKIPPKLIAEAKKEIGGGNPVTGKCFGSNGGAMVFQVAKAAPPALAAAVKKVAKRDTGLSIDPDFQLAGDADAEEQDTGPTAAPAMAPTAAASQAPPAGAEVAGFDLRVYQAARQNVITGLKALAAKVAATKHGSAAGVVKEIQSIITSLPANPAPNAIDKLRDFIAHDPTITAADQVPDHFHDLDIREPLLKALAAVKK